MSSLIRSPRGRRAVRDKLVRVTRIDVRCSAVSPEHQNLVNVVITLWEDKVNRGEITFSQDSRLRGHVGQSDAEPGWGGLLYQTALEVSTKLGRGLVSDRWNVSNAARNVWHKFAARADAKDGIQRWRMAPWPGAAAELADELDPQDFDGREDVLDSILSDVRLHEQPGGTGMQVAVFWSEDDWRDDPCAFLYAATSFPALKSGKAGGW